MDGAKLEGAPGGETGSGRGTGPAGSAPVPAARPSPGGDSAEAPRVGLPASGRWVGSVTGEACYPGRTSGRDVRRWLVHILPWAPPPEGAYLTSGARIVSRRSGREGSRCRWG